MAWSFSANSFVSATEPRIGARLDATVTTGADAHATGGMVLAELANYFTTIATAELIDSDGTYHVKWDGGTPAAGKLIVYLEDSESGVSADAGTADLSSAPGTLRVRFTGTALASVRLGGVTTGTAITNGVG